MSSNAYAFAIVNDLFDEDLDSDFFDDPEFQTLLGSDAPAAGADGPDPSDPKRLLQ